MGSFGLQLQDDKERQIYKNFGTPSVLRVAEKMK
jgi:hypothetical protein